MTVQAGSSDKTVTLEVQYTNTGSCCGGAFQWDTGDGATGSLDDGTVGGTYAGDASGSGSLSDGRSFSWTRTHPGPVKITISYDYPSYGTYTIQWQDCCPTKSGSVEVTLEPERKCKEVGVGARPIDLGVYVFVGTDRRDVGGSVPAVGGGACVPEVA